MDEGYEVKVRGLLPLLPSLPDPVQPNPPYLNSSQSHRRKALSVPVQQPYDGSDRVATSHRNS